MHAIVERMIRESLGDGAAVEGLQKLHGDASYRTYYRANLTDGRSFIVMQMPAGKSSASEEITNFAGAPGELPFINVQRYLARLGLPVPRIYTYNDTDRLMLIEDLGDGLMARQVELAPEPERLAWYGRALELLLLASETPRPVNTMYAARWREPPRCADAETLARPLAPGEVRIGPGLSGSGCFALGGLGVCR